MTPRRRTRPTVGPLTRAQEHELTHGGPHDQFWPSSFDSKAEKRAAWEEHGERLTREYAEDRPGQRPAAWWAFEVDRDVSWDDAPDGYGDLPPEAAWLAELGELAPDEYRALTEEGD